MRLQPSAAMSITVENELVKGMEEKSREFLKQGAKA